MALWDRFSRTQVQTDDDTQTESDDSPVATETPAEPPKYVTTDEMQRMINESMQGIVQRMQQPQTPLTPQAPAFTLPPEISEEDIAAALEDGDYKKALKLQRQQRERDRLQFQHDLNQLRTEGASAIGDLAEQVTLEKNPDYKKYKREVDEYLARFPVNVQKDPGVRDAVLNMVRGRHMDEIVAERIEQEKRKATLKDEPQDPRSGTSQRRQVGKGQEASPFRDEDFEALRFQNMSNDEFARKLGYDNWAAYLKMQAAYEKKPTHRRGRRV